MATITGITAEKMQEYVDAYVVSGHVNELGSLILVTHDGTEMDAGAVMDPLQPGTQAQYYRGDKTWQTLNPTAVGLSDVNNTSDANKPISTLQTAKNVEYDKLSKGLTRFSNVTASKSFTNIWSLVDNLVSVALVSGRWYRVEARVTSLVIGESNLAYAIDLRKSVTTDVTEAGTSIDNSVTLYSAPAASQGKTDTVSWAWKATATETVNLKLASSRAAGTASYALSERKFNLYDMGQQV